MYAFTCMTVTQRKLEQNTFHWDVHPPDFGDMWYDCDGNYMSKKTPY